MTPTDCDDQEPSGARRQASCQEQGGRRQALSGEDYLLFSAPARKLKNTSLSKGEEWSDSSVFVCYLSVGNSQDDKG